MVETIFFKTLITKIEISQSSQALGEPNHERPIITTSKGEKIWEIQNFTSTESDYFEEENQNIFYGEIGYF